MPGQTNIDAKNPFNSEEKPEKLKPILPPDIDASFRNYDKGYKNAFADKLKEELKRQGDD